MRFVSLGLCTVVALACGDGDQSVIDPNFLNPPSGAGSDSEATSSGAGAGGGGKKPDVGEPGSAEPGTAQPELSACAAAPEAEACSAENPADNAAATGTELPEGAGGSSGDSGGSAGSDTTGGGATGGKDGAGGTSGTSGGAGSAGGPNGEGGSSGSGASGGSGNESELLPDLIIDGAYLMATIQQDVVDASADQCLFNEGCVTGDGPRRVVRFGTRSANVGSADVIVGAPVAGNPLWEFDVCHEHFHFEGYARYDLVEAQSGEVLPIGNKNGFCLRDLDSWNNPSCATYDCDYQGISVGCADVYTPDLDCQWVDITDVAPGTYDLVVTVNTERSIRELSFDNNSATVTIEILPETVRIVP